MNNQLNYFFVLLFIAFLALWQPSYADPPLPTPVGRVVWVKGTLNAVMDNKEKRTLQKTSVIYLHDTLITDPLSQAQIIFTDNTLMSFRENTTFEISQYQYKPKSKSAGKFIMNLIEGGFRTLTGFIAKQNPDDYQVNTPVATIGVRGTDYAVYVHHGELYIGYYSGKPCVKSLKKVSPTTLCLDKNGKYARVGGPGEDPVPLSEQPEQLKVDLAMVPATIDPFGGDGGLSSGGMSSFCIQ